MDNRIHFPEKINEGELIKCAIKWSDSWTFIEKIVLYESKKENEFILVFYVDSKEAAEAAEAAEHGKPVFYCDSLLHIQGLLYKCSSAVEWRYYVEANESFLSEIDDPVGGRIIHELNWTLYERKTAKQEHHVDLNKGDNYFVLSGDYWKVSFNKSEEVMVNNSKGMKYIAYLLSNPGQNIPILKLMKGIEGMEHTATEYDNMTDEQLADIGMRKTGAPPDKDRNKDMKEAQRLLIELTKAKEAGIQMEIDEAQKEYDDFTSDLLSDKTNVDKGFETQRKRIQKLMKNTIKNIGKVHSELGEHLRTTIVTGVSCSYIYQEEPIDWYVKY